MEPGVKPKCGSGLLRPLGSAQNPAVQANRDMLEERGMRILGPDHGSQACGETGEGRMLDPDHIVAAVSDSEFAGPIADGSLNGKMVLITAEAADGLPEAELQHALAANRPLVLVIPDARGRQQPAVIGSLLRRQLGMAE